LLGSLRRSASRPGYVSLAGWAWKGMARHLARKDPWNSFVGVASAASSSAFAFGKFIEIGEVTLASGTFEASEGAHVRFPKLTLAVHGSTPINLDWRSPNSDHVKSSLVRGGQAMLSDAEVPVWKRWMTPRSIFAFTIDAAFVTRISQQLFDGAPHGAIDTHVGLDDPIVDRLASLGRQELENGGANGRLYVESLASSLAVHLLRRYGTSMRKARLSKGGLSPRQLRRVVDYVHDHLDRDLALAELAAVAGLSPHHFGEAFKTSTGQPPHRYVMGKRVTRARELLWNQELSISDVAYALGFASQSHFTTQFGRVTGITPGRFRRSLR
jgi:AraC family transcriptional regulator